MRKSGQKTKLTTAASLKLLAGYASIAAVFVGPLVVKLRSNKRCMTHVSSIPHVKQNKKNTTETISIFELLQLRPNSSGLREPNAVSPLPQLALNSPKNVVQYGKRTLSKIKQSHNWYQTKDQKVTVLIVLPRQVSSQNLACKKPKCADSEIRITNPASSEIKVSLKWGSFCLTTSPIERRNSYQGILI